MSKTVLIQLPDGSSNQINIFPSKTASKKVVVIFPALGVKASYYNLLGEQLAENGIECISIDLRGNGNSSIKVDKHQDFGYKDLIDLEYVSCFNWVKENYQDKKVFLLGHSLGGQLGSLFASRHRDFVDGLILIASCSVYFKSWKGFGRLKLKSGVSVIRNVTNLMGYFPGKKMGFGGTEAKTLMMDWSNQARTGKYILTNEPFDYEESLSQLDLPVLAISFKEDQYAPTEAVQHLYHKFKSKDLVRHIVLSQKEVNNDGRIHFSWTKKPERIIELIQGFI